MATKVAINGFGRIGRLVARALLERDDHDLELVAINDLADAEANALLFQYDSTHGRFPGSVSVEGDAIKAGSRSIAVTSEREPGKLPHRDMGVELVLECTGLLPVGRGGAAAYRGGREAGADLGPGEGRFKNRRLRREPRFS